MLTWSDEYRIGHQEMDGEHITLFALLNQLDINIGANDSATCVGDLLRALLSYISFHFAHEEALMAAYGYPNLPQHTSAHEALIAETCRLGQRAGSVDGKAVALEIRGFVRDWLPRHIREEDLRYSTHIREVDQATVGLGTFPRHLGALRHAEASRFAPDLNRQTSATIWEKR